MSYILFKTTWFNLEGADGADNFKKDFIFQEFQKN